MSNPARSIFDSVRPLLRRALPQLCTLCAAPCGHDLLCLPCSRSLPALRDTCPRCALPGAQGLCVRCAARPPPWALACAAFAYAYPLDRLVHALKYRGALAYGPLLAQELARAVTMLPDVIVAVPLSIARQRARGYNQALEIARPLASLLQRPLFGALARSRDTPALAALPWRERRRSMAGAFVANAPLHGQHVALVDDVLTTGATLGAATRALLAGGASRVDVWVVARTLPPS